MQKYKTFDQLFEALYNYPNPPDPDPMMGTHDEADFIPRERLGANNDMAPNQSQSAEEV